MIKQAAQLVVPTEPWWMPSVVQFVQRYLKEQHMVLEFGSGGSTIWLAERACVYSVEEENIVWYQAVEEALHHNVLCAGSKISWQKEPPIAMEFDWLFLDGGDRVAHGMQRIPHVKDGGYIVLDDAERFYSYYPLLASMNIFHHRDFYDIASGPNIHKPRQTVIWQKHRLQS